MLYVFILLLLFCLSLYGFLLWRGLINFPAVLNDRPVTLWVSIILFVLTIEATATWGYYGTPTPQQAMIKSGVQTVTSVLAFLMRKHLDFPVEINDNIRLVDIQANGSALVYKMQVDAQDSSSFVNITKNIKDDLMKNACARDDYKQMLKYGLSVKIDLYTPGWFSADPILITPQYCGI